VIVEEHLEVKTGVHVDLQDSRLLIGDILGVFVDFMLPDALIIDLWPLVE
jgi:hypothetical protein